MNKHSQRFYRGLTAAVQLDGWYLLLLVAVVLATLPMQGQAQVLGSAQSFGVLAGQAVTSTGDTVVNGDLGIYPGTSITGFLPGIVNGTIYNGTTAALQAQNDATAAYLALKYETPFQDLSGENLGGMTLDAGAWGFSTSAQLTGILTLDAQGDSNARFDFLIGSTLTTDSSAEIILINGASADEVFWQVGSSATLGAGTSFEGSIIAYQSITLDAGADVMGSILALNGSVTLIDNVITAVPEPHLSWLLAICVVVMSTRCWLARKQGCGKTSVPDGK